MLRSILVALATASCALPVEHHEPMTEGPPFRACKALYPPLPKIRTIASVNDRLAELEAKYPDCAERLRLAIKAYDDLKGALP